MTRRVRRRVGDVLAVPLSDGKTGFACVLAEPLVAFFDCLRDEVPDHLAFLTEEPVAFRIWVMNYAITKRIWPVVGTMTPTDELSEPPWFFKQDVISGALTRTRGGAEEVPATIEECRVLERAAVWDPEHAAERLADRFAGRPCQWVDPL